MRSTLTIALVLVQTAGCAPGAATTALLVPEDLAATPVERDPLADHRPEPADCPAGSFGPEGGGFEVQTGVCAYGAFDHPVGVDLAAGDTVAISVWHDTLDAAAPATGHAAVWLDSTVLWQGTFEIPSPSAAHDVVIVLDEAVAADAPLGVHVHNHGFNSWRFIRVDLTSD